MRSTPLQRLSAAHAEEVRKGAVHTPVVHVCPLAYVPLTSEEIGAGHLVTLLSDISRPPTPAGILPGRHLRLDVDDIIRPQPGHTVPQRQHVDRLIAFASEWDMAQPMLIHCLAGVSRSTAAAFIVMCLASPSTPELSIARALRRTAPWAWPNELLVSLADEALDRRGRMVKAVGAIGPGHMGVTPEPFQLAPPFG